MLEDEGERRWEKRRRKTGGNGVVGGKEEKGKEDKNGSLFVANPQSNSVSLVLRPFLSRWPV